MSPMTLVARHAPDHAILTNISRDNDFVLAHRADLAWEEPGQPPPRQPFRMLADRTALMINFPLTTGASQHLVITFQCGLAGNTLTGASTYDVLGLAGNAPTGSSNRSLNSLPLRLI